LNEIKKVKSPKIELKSINECKDKEKDKDKDKDKYTSIYNPNPDIKRNSIKKIFKEIKNKMDSKDFTLYELNGNI
jgi:hypothetical protein